MQLSGGLGKGLEKETSIFLKLRLSQKGSLSMLSPCLCYEAKACVEINCYSIRHTALTYSPSKLTMEIKT